MPPDNFGYETAGTATWSCENKVLGSNADCPETGTADSITVALNVTTEAHTCKCAIYRESDSDLIDNGITEEKSVPVGDTWVTFNFTGTKPSLSAETYVLTCWCQNVSGGAVIRRSGGAGYSEYNYNKTYDAFDDPATFTEYSNIRYSIYCSYTPAAAGAAGAMSLNQKYWGQTI